MRPAAGSCRSPMGRPARPAARRRYLCLTGAAADLPLRGPLSQDLFDSGTARCHLLGQVQQWKGGDQCLTSWWRVWLRRTRLWSRPPGSVDGAETSNHHEIRVRPPYVRFGLPRLRTRRFSCPTPSCEPRVARHRLSTSGRRLRRIWSIPGTQLAWRRPQRKRSGCWPCYRSRSGADFAQPQLTVA